MLICYGIGTLISNQFRPELEATFSSHVVLARDLTGNIWSGMLLNLALVAALFLLFRNSELKRTGELKPLFSGGNLFWRDGRFTVLTGGIIIALLNSSVVALHGSAWTITGAVYDMALRGASLFGLFEGTPSWPSHSLSTPWSACSGSVFWGPCWRAASAVVVTSPRCGSATVWPPSSAAC